MMTGVKMLEKISSCKQIVIIRFNKISEIIETKIKFSVTKLYSNNNFAAYDELIMINVYSNLLQWVLQHSFQ